MGDEKKNWLGGLIGFLGVWCGISAYMTVGLRARGNIPAQFGFITVFLTVFSIGLVAGFLMFATDGVASPKIRFLVHFLIALLIVIALGLGIVVLTL